MMLITHFFTAYLGISRYGPTSSVTEERMLASALQHDELQNWSIYEERDGKYTFKLRFHSKKVSHISSCAIQDSEQINSESFKRKSAKQKLRDNKRTEDFQNKRVTRTRVLQLNEII